MEESQAAKSMSGHMGDSPGAMDQPRLGMRSDGGERRACVENDVSAGKRDLWVRVQKRQAGCRLSQWPWRVAASVEVPLDGRAHRKAGQLLYSI